MFFEYSCDLVEHENVMAHAFHLFGPHSLSLSIASHRITFSSHFSLLSLCPRFARASQQASISSLVCCFYCLMLVIARRISFSIFHSFFSAHKEIERCVSIHDIIHCSKYIYSLSLYTSPVSIFMVRVSPSSPISSSSFSEPLSPSPSLWLLLLLFCSRRKKQRARVGTRAREREHSHLSSHSTINAING